MSDEAKVKRLTWLGRKFRLVACLVGWHRWDGMPHYMTCERCGQGGVNG